MFSYGIVETRVQVNFIWSIRNAAETRVVGKSIVYTLFRKSKPKKPNVHDCSA